MSRSINHGFEDKCSEDTFNEIYNMAYERGKNNGIDEGRQALIDEIMEHINSSNRGSVDYFIVDRIEEICMKYKTWLNRNFK